MFCNSNFKRNRPQGSEWNSALFLCQKVRKIWGFRRRFAPVWQRAPEVYVSLWNFVSIGSDLLELFPKSDFVRPQYMYTRLACNAAVLHNMPNERQTLISSSMLFKPRLIDWLLYDHGDMVYLAVSQIEVGDIRSGWMKALDVVAQYRVTSRVRCWGLWWTRPTREAPAYLADDCWLLSDVSCDQRLWNDTPFRLQRPDLSFPAFRQHLNTFLIDRST